MAITRLGGANAITGTIPQGNIANASLGAVTALPAGVGGKVLQVVSTSNATETTSTSTSWVNTTLTVNITPSSSSNKIYIVGSANTQSVANEKNNLSIFRDSSNLGPANSGFGRSFNNEELMEKATISYLDSPSTTSQVTYTLKLRSTNGGDVQINCGSSRGAITVMEVSA